MHLLVLTYEYVNSQGHVGYIVKSGEGDNPNAYANTRSMSVYMGSTVVHADFDDQGTPREANIIIGGEQLSLSPEQTQAVVGTLKPQIDNGEFMTVVNFAAELDARDIDLSTQEFTKDSSGNIVAVLDAESNTKFTFNINTNEAKYEYQKQVGDETVRVVDTRKYEGAIVRFTRDEGSSASVTFTMDRVEYQ